MSLDPAKISHIKDTNRDRFVRIAELRVNRILDDLDKLVKVSDRKNYDYSDKDVKTIFREIEKKTKEIKSMFLGTSKSRNRFKLAK